MFELICVGGLAALLVWGCNKWLHQNVEPRDVEIVCAACGRIKHQHQWAACCPANAYEVYKDSIDYDAFGRVMSAVATGRILSDSDRRGGL